jgi:hypothetical protein
MSDSTSSSTAVIAPNGNVILVVGPHERRIQVSSSVLQNASKYFCNMFGPHFLEGQDLGGNDPKEIVMPDDDANVLEIICNIFHLRNDAVPETLSPTVILEIAVAADKFDCIVAIKLASTLWLVPKENHSIIELGQLMAAAYVLNNARSFKEITLSMILGHKDSYLPLADEEVGLVNKVPWETVCEYYPKIFKFNTNASL